MSSTLSISPITLATLTGISPLALQNLTSASAATDPTLLETGASVVELSGLGQVLSATSGLQDALDALQSSTTTSTPNSVITQASAFVSAFDKLQQNISSVAPFFGVLPDTTSVDQLAQSLNQATNSTGNTNLASLQDIGISVQSPTTLAAAGSGTTLILDTNVLSTAANANPAATATELAQATQSLLVPVAQFAAQTMASKTTSTQTDLSLPLTSIPTSSLQSLPADAILNNLQLSNLDLAAAGLDINSIQTNSALLQSSFNADLLAATNATTTAVTPTPTITSTINLPTTGLTGTLNPILATTPAVSTPPTETAATTIPFATAATTATSTASITTAAPTGTAADVQTAEQNALNATQAVQDQVNDPDVRALNNNLFNPDYSPVMAASRPGDFVTPQIMTSLRGLAPEIPQAVSAVAASRAIDDDRQASGSNLRR